MEKISSLLREKEAMATDMITSTIQQMMESDVDIPVPDGVDAASVDTEATKAKMQELMKTVSDYGVHSEAQTCYAFSTI